MRSTHFNPLPPRGGRPPSSSSSLGKKSISIHSLLAEGDPAVALPLLVGSYFNPLPPRGGRPFAGFDRLLDRFRFQSTPSSRRETVIGDTDARGAQGFQSTPSSRRETTAKASPASISAFQSTPSSRRETRTDTAGLLACTFQSTPSSRRETPGRHPLAGDYFISIHSLLAEGDPSPLPPLKTDVYFNPLPPRGGRRESGTSKRTKGAISIHSLLAEGDTPSLRRSKRPV